LARALLTKENRMSVAVVGALKEHRRKHYRSDASELPEHVGALVYSDPFAFLVGAAFDRGMPWRRAWEIPYWINRRGMLSAATLSAMEKSGLQRLLESLPVKPRYGCRQGAETLKGAAALVMEFGGEAAAIWENASPSQVEERLTGIYGVGQGLAAMTIRILRDDWGMFRGSERDIDVKADVHVRRVFKRAGLIPIEDEGSAVRAARRLNPDFPGELDWPAWDIGMKWCAPKDPNCCACPLTKACPKRI